MTCITQGCEIVRRGLNHEYPFAQGTYASATLRKAHQELGFEASRKAYPENSVVLPLVQCCNNCDNPSLEYCTRGRQASQRTYENIAYAIQVLHTANKLRRTAAANALRRMKRTNTQGEAAFIDIYREELGTQIERRIHGASEELRRLGIEDAKFYESFLSIIKNPNIVQRFRELMDPSQKITIEDSLRTDVGNLLEELNDGRIAGLAYRYLTRLETMEGEQRRETEEYFRKIEVSPSAVDGIRLSVSKTGVTSS